MPDLVIRFRSDSKEVRDEIKRLGGQVQKELSGDRAQNKIFGDLGNQAKNLGNDIARVFRGDVSGAFDAVKSSAGLVGSSFGALGASAATAAVGVGALAAAVVALEAAFVLIALRQAEFLDKIGDISESTGISADVVLQFRQAFAAFADDAAGAEQVLQKFTATVGRALQDPTNDAAKALRQLGLNAREAAQNPSQALLKLADSFARIDTQAERARLATELFGRGGAQVAAVLVEMSKSAADFEQALAAVGGRDAFNKLVQQAGQFDVEMRRFQNTLQVVALVIVREFLPTIRVFNEQLGPLIRDLMPALTVVVQGAELAFRGLLATMTSMAKGMADLSEAAQAIGRGEFKRAVDEIRESLTHPVWEEFEELTRRRAELLNDPITGGLGARDVTEGTAKGDQRLAQRKREIEARAELEAAALQREQEELERALGNQVITRLEFERRMTELKLSELESRQRKEEALLALEKLNDDERARRVQQLTRLYETMYDAIEIRGERLLEEQIRKVGEEINKTTDDAIRALPPVALPQQFPEEEALERIFSTPDRTIFTDLRDAMNDLINTMEDDLPTAAEITADAMANMGAQAARSFRTFLEGNSTLRQAAGAMAAALLEPFVVYAQQQAAIAALESAMAFLRLDFVGGAKWAAIAAGWAALSGGLAAIGSAAGGGAGGGGGGGGAGATGTTQQTREVEDRIRYWEGGIMQPVTTIIIKHEEGMFVDKVEQAMVTSFQNDGAAKRLIKRETEGTPIR